MQESNICQKMMEHWVNGCRIKNGMQVNFNNRSLSTSTLSEKLLIPDKKIAILYSQIQHRQALGKLSMKACLRYSFQSRNKYL